MFQLKKFVPSPLARKVPEITIFFWIIKILTTGMGETTSDFLVKHIDPFVAVGLGGLGFCGALLLQFLATRYVPWVYWLTVTMVAIFGTMVADVMHVGLGIPYGVSTVFFAVGLVMVFGLWYRFEKTLSIHSINTTRRELFYWATIVVTFALGTAVGDMTATTLGLGYFASGLLFSVLFAIPLFANSFFLSNEILTFWSAYIVTRPLGASFADWLGRDQALGGVGIGTGKISLCLAVLVIGLVGYLTVTQKPRGHEEKEGAELALK